MKRSTSVTEPSNDPLIDEHVRRGYLEPIKAGRETIYRLTPAGLQRVVKEHDDDTDNRVTMA